MSQGRKLGISFTSMSPRIYTAPPQKKLKTILAFITLLVVADITEALPLSKYSRFLKRLIIKASFDIIKYVVTPNSSIHNAQSLIPSTGELSLVSRGTC